MRRTAWALSSALVVLPGLSQAEEDLVNFIPNGRTAYFGERDNCKICHIRPQGDGERNAFGEAYGAAPGIFFRWPNLYNLDSDGDGQTNGEELGDPEGLWRPQQEPPRTWPISLPGDPDSTSILDGDAGPPPDFGPLDPEDAAPGEAGIDGSSSGVDGSPRDAGPDRDAGMPSDADVSESGGDGCRSVTPLGSGAPLAGLVALWAARRRRRPAGGLEEAGGGAAR